jgi:hypothetical protein
VATIATAISLPIETIPATLTSLQIQKTLEGRGAAVSVSKYMTFLSSEDKRVMK